MVLDYFHVRGFPASSHKFLQSWPRRDLASLDLRKTLGELKFPKKEAIRITPRED